MNLSRKQFKIEKEMNLLEKIDELRANKVTPEKFESVWGTSIEDHLDRLMAFVEEQSGKDAAKY